MFIIFILKELIMFDLEYVNAQSANHRRFVTAERKAAEIKAAVAHVLKVYVNCSLEYV